MTIELKLLRYDREGRGDHFYGDNIDAMLNDLVGGDSAWSTPRNDRESRPRAMIGDTDIPIELHEDGPEIVIALVEQIPETIAAIAALISAWCAWKSSRKEEQPPFDKRVVNITVKNLYFSGPAEPQQVEKIATTLAELNQELGNGE